MAHRRLAFTLIACLATAPLAAQQAAPTPAADAVTKRTLYRLEAEWAEGVVKRDAATIRRMTAPRWVYSDESGTMNREQGVAAFTSGPDTVTSSGNDEMRAEVYGNTAIVVGVLWMRGHNAQGAFTHRYRYTDTWMKLGGRWQCVASQDYLMPEGAP